MFLHRRKLPFLVVLATGAYAAIGPVTDLHIVNQDLAPDGVTRPTVLAGGTFPGPLIRGNKVRFALSQTFTDRHSLRS